MKTNKTKSTCRNRKVRREMHRLLKVLQRTRRANNGMNDGSTVNMLLRMLSN